MSHQEDAIYSNPNYHHQFHRHRRRRVSPTHIFLSDHHQQMNGFYLSRTSSLLSLLICLSVFMTETTGARLLQPHKVTQQLHSTSTSDSQISSFSSSSLSSPSSSASSLMSMSREGSVTTQHFSRLSPSSHHPDTSRSPLGSSSSSSLISGQTVQRPTEQKFLTYQLKKFVECRQDAIETNIPVTIDDDKEGHHHVGGRKEVTEEGSFLLKKDDSLTSDDTNYHVVFGHDDTTSSSHISHPADVLSCGFDFDGISCWPKTLPTETAFVRCPDFIPFSNASANVTRVCLSDGSWSEEGNYSACQFNPHTINTPSERDLLTRLMEEVSKLDDSPFADASTTMAFEECLPILSKPLPPEGSNVCPRTFDGWGCWDDTPANSTAFTPCPTFMPGFLPDRKAFKVCLEDGSWFRHPLTNKTWSNYTTCIDQEDLSFRQKINNVYISGYTISVIALLISLAIFFSFTSLKCDRITIHKNLFISFIINNTVWIIWYTCVIYQPEVIVSNEFHCQALHVIVHYFLVCNYFWMFCEGLYLHTLLVIAFVSEEKILKWFYGIGWGIPLLLTIAYASARGSSPADTEYCWIEESKYTWILNGPVVLSMLLNFFFLINIVRVLVTKLRAVNSPESHQTRKAVRATLILIPLLGLQYVLTPFRPAPGSPGENVYEVLAAVFTSFQGLCVAMLFCFFNGEVIAAVKKCCSSTNIIQRPASKQRNQNQGRAALLLRRAKNGDMMTTNDADLSRLNGVNGGGRGKERRNTEETHIILTTNSFHTIVE